MPIFYNLFQYTPGNLANIGVTGHHKHDQLRRATPTPQGGSILIYIWEGYEKIWVLKTIMASVGKSSNMQPGMAQVYDASKLNRS